MKPILEIKNLTVSIKRDKERTKLLRNINLSLFPFEKLGIVGESGSGKTLLMKTILSILPHNASIDAGEIWYNDTNLLLLKEKQMQKIRGKEIGMIFQDPMTSLNPLLKIGTQIAEGTLRHNPLLSKKQGESLSLQLLEQVGVPEPKLRLHQYPHQLSGGLRQRIVIALALAMDPKILIADEPTTALDVTIQAQILDLLKKLQKNKNTLFITHDLSLIASFCDRVAIMYAGQIIEEGDVEELFKNPKHPYTKKLFQSIPRLDQKTEKLVPIPGSSPDLNELGTGCSFYDRCPSAINICCNQPPPIIEKTRCWLLDPKRQNVNH
jgi:oligopeptide/dipeptide ABC transporter ATP-binding protein